MLAAQTLGIMRVPAVVVDHLSEAELKAYMIADNKLTENAKWNDKLLGELFLDLSALDLDFGLDVTGFEPPQIDLLIQGLDLVEANRDDALPDVPAGPALSHPGDLWLLGSASRSVRGRASHLVIRHADERSTRRERVYRSSL